MNKLNNKIFQSSYVLLVSFLCLFLLGIHKLYAQNNSNQPNIIIFLADDMGYGDLQSYGNPTIRTPNIDAIGREGIRFTSFETAPWCVPSRAELMTGRYKGRTEFGGGTGAGEHGGLPDTVLTLAQSLKDAGYATGMVGKWHLGYDPKEYLPTNRGFDSWLGLPYSNDYIRPYVNTDVPLVMYRDTTVAEYPVNQDSLTVKYTQEAIRFIKEQKHKSKDQPFFFYFAYNMPHLPLHTTDEFYGRSNAGLYGDVIETIDWSVGEVLKVLKEEGLYENTIVYFGSDNGPWQEADDRMFKKPNKREGSNDKIWERRGNKPWDVGSSGALRGYKHTTYEGGPRVPALIRWPEKIQPGRVTDELVTHLDLYTTFVKIGDGSLPDYKIDGMDVMPFLLGEENSSPRNEFGYFINDLQAIRVGQWKFREVNGNPELYNMQYDASELYNQAAEYPEIVGELRSKMIKLAKDVGVETTAKKVN